MKPGDKRVSVPPDVLVRDVQGESVLLNLATESYFGLDEVGTAMWRALVSAASLEEACRTLMDEFDVEPARLRADMEDFVGRLEQAGLVEVKDV